MILVFSKASPFRSGLFGVTVAAGSIVVLAHGLLNFGASFTAILLVVPLLGLAALAPRHDLRVSICDVWFLILTVAIGVSVALNGYSDGREACLLLVALGHYIAGRAISPAEARRGILIVGCAVLLMGLGANAVALVEQWSERHGKPLVFGKYDSAPAQFAMLLGFVLVAALSTRMTRAQRGLVIVLAAVASIILAASMVRFTLLAIAMSLALSLALDPAVSRRKMFLAVGALCVLVCVGLAARWSTSSVYVNHLLTAAHIKPVAPDARLQAPAFPGCPKIDIDNSIAIRKQLLADAARMLPQAGAFGFGAGGFTARSCVKGAEVHDSFIEAFLEFGWIAGVALLLLLVYAARAVLPLTAISADYRFAASSLFYIALLSLAHGRVNRDFMLFAVLGLAAGMGAARRAVASRWMLRGVEPLTVSADMSSPACAAAPAQGSNAPH